MINKIKYLFRRYIILWLQFFFFRFKYLFSRELTIYIQRKKKKKKFKITKQSLIAKIQNGSTGAYGCVNKLLFAIYSWILENNQTLYCNMPEEYNAFFVRFSFLFAAIFSSLHNNRSVHRVTDKKSKINSGIFLI